MKKVGIWLLRYCLIPVGQVLLGIVGGIFCIIYVVVSYVFEACWILLREILVVPTVRRKLITVLTKARSDQELRSALKMYDHYDGGWDYMSVFDELTETLRLGALLRLMNSCKDRLSLVIPYADSAEACRDIANQCYVGQGATLDALANEARRKMLAFIERDLRNAQTMGELRRLKGLLQYHHSSEWKKLQQRCSVKIQALSWAARLAMYPT